MPDEVRFEGAPDGVLIPIPTETIPLPGGGSTMLREDSQARVHPKTPNGYYVVINNFDSSNHEAAHLFLELLQEGGIATLEQLAARAFSTVPHVVYRLAGIAAAVLVSLFTPSKITQEIFIRARLEDGTPITYCILT